MPVRIYDISVKLGLDSKVVLAKAKSLGIAAAKVPTSSLDKITAEYLEDQLHKDHSNLSAHAPTVVAAFPPKPQITITATGTELYRLVERVLNGEAQFRFEFSETESSEPLRLCLVRDVSQKTSDLKPKLELTRVEIDERTKKLLRVAYDASRLNCTDDWVNLADFGNAIKKLDSTFQPQNFGERSLGSLLRRVTDLFELRNDESNPIVYYLRLKDEKSHSVSPVPIQVSQPVVPLIPKLARGKIHNLRLGFGFIMPDDGSENLFFHATDVEGCTIFDLKPGDAVEYEPGVNEKGPCGRKIRRLLS